jgi:hypothetical protein
MSNSERLFIELEPPAGGLLRLRHHVAASRSSQPQRRWQLASTFAVAATLIGCLWLPGAVTHQRRDAELVRALRQATAPPAGGIQVVDGAAIELPSKQSDVRIYLVQMAGPASLAQRQ